MLQEGESNRSMDSEKGKRLEANYDLNEKSLESGTRNEKRMERRATGATAASWPHNLSLSDQSPGLRS